jgi:TolB protein
VAPHVAAPVGSLTATERTREGTIVKTSTVRRAAIAGMLATGLLALTTACSSQAAPVPRAAAPAATGSAAVGQASSPAADAPPETDAQPVGVKPQLGRLTYLDRTREDQRALRWTVGAGQPVTLPSAFVGSVTNANVSPDGRWGSFTDDNNALRVVDLRTGANKLTLGGGSRIIEGDCVEPAWAPDSRHLLVGDASAGPAGEIVGTVDINTGAFTRLPTQIHGCHLTWSADGSAIGYAGGAGQIFVARADGSNQRAVPGLGGGTGPLSSFDLESVSVSGTRVALWVNDGSTPAGDVARGLYSNTILDTRTGQKINMPVSGELSQAVFRADGTTVVRIQGAQHNQLVLISAAGSVLTRVDEPTSLKNLVLLTA